jgi:3-hydroxyisobutyrate dehydrogenase-like beta-hydroxyacid dehydrogenase
VSGKTRVLILGLGEVGQILADDLSKTADVELGAYDIGFDDAESIPSRAVTVRSAVVKYDTAAQGSAASDMVISAVTAAEAVTAARSVAGSLTTGSYYLDLNSVSPQSRQIAAETITAAGGRFVEGVVMAPIGPRRIASPILLGGPHAAEFSGRAAGLGFSGARVYSEEIGPASAVKMCRSVVIKGMEALLAESLTAARHYGAEVAVLESLGNLLPLENWPSKARYMISRSLQHGARRAEEMEEVAATVAGAGLEPLMSEATVARQRWAARYVAGVDAALPDMLDMLLGGPDEREAPHG